MASQATDDSHDALLDKIDALSSLDEDDTREFVDAALDNIEEHLHSNLRDARNQSLVDENDDGGVSSVLSEDNVDSIKVRARPFENPKVTVWLKSYSPIWANDSWRDHIYPRGINAYNGKTTATFDVRPV